MTPRLFNRVLRWTMPVMGLPVSVTTYPANNSIPQTATRGWLMSQMRAPAKFASTGMMPTQYGGDVITVQTILRGVPPLDAAQLALLRQQQNMVK